MKLQFLITTFFICSVTFSKTEKKRTLVDPVPPQVAFKSNNKGDFYFDPQLCQYKIVRNKLEITLHKNPTTQIESFLVKFPDNRTVMGHVGSLSIPNKGVACFHSFSDTGNGSYRYSMPGSTKDADSFGNCLKGINADYELAAARKARPPTDSVKEKRERDNIDFLENRKVFAGVFVTEIDYESVKVNPVWSNKNVVRIQPGRGLIFYNGFGAEEGNIIERKDLRVSESDQAKCAKTKSFGQFKSDQPKGAGDGAKRVEEASK